MALTEKRPKRAMKRRVFIVRHGETEWNRELRLQGQMEVALNDVGRQEAAETGARLAQLCPEGRVALLTSDLARAADTCAIVAGKLGVDRASVVQTKLLRERSSGVHEGRLWSELAEGLGPAFHALPSPKFVTVLDAYTKGGETGESKEAFVRRAQAAGEEVTAFVDGLPEEVQTAVIVSHGLLIRTLLSLLCFDRARDEGWESRFSWPLLDVKNASISELRRQGSEWWAMSLNETGHLRPKEGDRYAI
jgi:broad specificity phosphatase PhoE